MRGGWFVGLGCLFLSPALHAGPLTPTAGPTASTADVPQVQKAEQSQYRVAEKIQLSNVNASLSIGNVGILMGIDSTEFVQAGGLYPVHQYDDTHPNAAKKVALIRNANHLIDGNEVNRVRAVGDADGSVYVFYYTRNNQGGRFPHVRKIKPDNTLGFDVTGFAEEKAGIAPDGAGGVYVVTHKTFDSDNDHWTDSTAHQSTRIDASGAIVWQVGEPGATQPHADSHYWSVAARSSQGVFAGYGVGTSGSNDPTPVLLHRKAGDGAVVFKKVGLKAPAAGGVGGPPGPSPLYGIVDRLYPQADGSVLGRVYKSTADNFFVRVDAGGTQTSAYKCPELGSQLLPHNNGVVCVTLPDDGTIKLHHYGISGGNLQKLGAWTSAPVDGWDFTHIVVTVDGQYLAAARTGTFAGLALFSSSGVLLKKELATARPGYFTGLTVGGHDWLAMHKGTHEADTRPSVWRGTFTPGLH